MEILEADRRLTLEEMEDLWEYDTRSWKNRQLFVGMVVPETFMRKHWGELSEEEHHNYFVHQKPSTQFLLDYWNILTENEKRACFEHQQLETEFLEYEWGRMKQDNKLTVARRQVLTPAFITSCFSATCSRLPLMNWFWKTNAIDCQKKFPARLVIENWEEATHSMYIHHHERRGRKYYCEDITMAELPEYLSCEFDLIRTSAEEWLSELQRRNQNAYEQEARAN